MITPRPFKERAMLVKVGRCVRAYRLANGMTQRDLSQRARVNRKWMSAFECGGENCSLTTLAKIAEVLECTLPDLLPADPSSDRVVLSAADLRRVREAVKVLDATITPR